MSCSVTCRFTTPSLEPQATGAYWQPVQTHLNLPNCPLCGREGQPLGNIRTYLAAFDLVAESHIDHCASCDFAWTTNPPDEASLARYYASNDQLRRDGLTSEEAHHIGGQLDFLAPTSGRHLEIGPDNGTFLDLMRQRSEGEFYFAEMNEEAAARLTAKGYEPDDGRAYATVTLRHVLEHIPSPVPFMASLAGRAERIFVEVPDYSALTLGMSDRFQFEHVNYFSITSLHALAKAAGLMIDRVEFAATPGYSTTPNRIMRAVLAPGKPSGVEDWRALLETDRRTFAKFSSAIKGRVALYGAGAVTMMLLAASGANTNLAAIYDVDPRKHGRSMLGTVVQSPEAIDESLFDVLVLTVVGYEREVRDYLRGRVPEAKIKSLAEFIK